jgi:hypothetical protein
VNDAIVGSTGGGWSGFIGCTVCGTGKPHNEDSPYSKERVEALHIERGFLRVASFLAPMYDVPDVFVCNDECEFKYLTEVGPWRLRKMREGRAKQGLEVR